MKKIIGILGIAVMASFVFLSTDNISNKNDIDLASIIHLSTANAELGGGCNTKCTRAIFFTCSYATLSTDNHFVTVTCPDMYRN